MTCGWQAHTTLAVLPAHVHSHEVIMKVEDDSQYFDDTKSQVVLLVTVTVINKMVMLIISMTVENMMRLVTHDTHQ